jgi:hypothetical protein
MALDWQCAWCGDDLPDYRLHENTCSHICAKSIEVDLLKLARESEGPPRVKKRKLKVPQSVA